MNNEKRACISEQVEKVKAQLNAAAKLTADLAESMADPTDWTLADLYDAEYIAENLRNAINKAPVFLAICHLTESAILNGDDLRAVGLDIPEETTPNENNQ